MAKERGIIINGERRIKMDRFLTEKKKNDNEKTEIK